MAASVSECLILINLEISPIISKFFAVIKHFFNKSCKFENLPIKNQNMVLTRQFILW